MNYYDEDLLDGLYEGAIVVDKYRNIMYWNEGAERITGYSKAEVLNKKTTEFLLHIDLKGTPLVEDGCPLLETAKNQSKIKMTYVFRNKDSKLVPIDIKTFPIINKGGYLVGVLEIFKNRNEEILEKSEIAEIKNLAYKDVMSDLYNRKCAIRTIDDSMAKFRSDEEPFVAMMFDVSNIYEIHSKYKKNIKDHVLTNIADTILRNIDESTIACRWSEEKYVLILKNAKQAIGMMLADRIATALEHSTIRWNDEMIKLRVKKSVYVPEKFDKTGDIVENLMKSLS